MISFRKHVFENLGLLYLKKTNSLLIIIDLMEVLSHLEIRKRILYILQQAQAICALFILFLIDRVSARRGYVLKSLNSFNFLFRMEILFI